SSLPTMFETMAELGPGDSLGIGLAALLSGTRRYIALDVLRYADRTINLRIFEELISLFRDRAPVPSETEFPLVWPQLPSYDFPANIITSTRLDVALQPKRLELIRLAIENPPASLRNSAPVCYVAPWKPGMIENDTVDLIL